MDQDKIDQLRDHYDTTEVAEQLADATPESCSFCGYLVGRAGRSNDELVEALKAGAFRTRIGVVDYSTDPPTETTFCQYCYSCRAFEVSIQEMLHWLNESHPRVDEAADNVFLVRRSQATARMAEAYLVQYIRDKMGLSDFDPDPEVIAEPTDDF